VVVQGLSWRQCVTALLLVSLQGLVHAAAGLWQVSDDFVDEFGTRARLSHWAGPETIVAMEYSECRFVCTINWRKLVDIQAAADRQRRQVRFLIVSLDPAHDTPAAWRDYRKLRGLDRPNWNFVTGSRSATDKVVGALGVKWWYFNESIMHDFRVLRLSADGQVLAVMNNFDQPADAFLGR